MKKIPIPAWTLAILRAFVMAAVVGIICPAGSRAFSEVPVLDPNKIPAAETRMWQAYYARDLLRLHNETAALLRAQFRIPPADAEGIAGSLVGAAMKFAP